VSFSTAVVLVQIPLSRIFGVSRAVDFISLFRYVSRYKTSFAPEPSHASFATLAVLFWPYMIPYSVTVASATPEASLSFLFWGAGLFVLPIITIYSIAVFWMFRGKMREGYR
jgi:cytochrome bd-type quinol oxidase subunit 2